MGILLALCEQIVARVTAVRVVGNQKEREQREGERDLVTPQAADRAVMKERVSGLLSEVLTWSATAVMGTAGLALAVTMVHPI